MSTSSELKISKTTLGGAILGSVAGGMVFGMLMQMMSMMKSVAMLVNSNSIAVGWIIHLIISMVFGVAYFVVLQAAPIKAPGAILGMMYGVILWVVGFLFLMPAKLHMQKFHFDAMAWKSLMGHMIFGVILGFVATRSAEKK